MQPGIFRVPLSVIAAGGSETERNGDVLPDWSSSRVTQLLLGWVQPVGSSEDADLRDAQIARFILYLPSHALIASYNRIQWGERILRPEGPAREFRAGMGKLHHLELTCVEIVG